MKYQFLGMLTGELQTKEIRVTPPEQREVKIKPARVFPVFKLAGEYFNDENRFLTPIYHKGEATIVDGFYASDMPAWRDPHFARPGRLMVCFQRRGRITPDRFAFSSEQPVAWGTIQSIDGNKLIVEAPAIQEVPTSGKQTIQIDTDAEYFYLGVPVNKDKVLRSGAIVQVYAKRPQTILVNAGEKN